MKLQEKFENMLVESGMFPEQAREVMQAVMDDEASESMRGRWQDDEEDYPSGLIAAIWYSVKDHAREWIDANCPKAWYRPLFA